MVHCHYQVLIVHAILLYGWITVGLFTPASPQTGDNVLHCNHMTAATLLGNRMFSAPI